MDKGEMLMVFFIIPSFNVKFPKSVFCAFGLFLF